MKKLQLSLGLATIVAALTVLTFAFYPPTKSFGSTQQTNTVFYCLDCAHTIHCISITVCPICGGSRISHGNGNSGGGSFIFLPLTVAKIWYDGVPTTRTLQQAPITRFAVLGNNIWPCQEWPNKVSSTTQFRTCYVAFN